MRQVILHLSAEGGTIHRKVPRSVANALVAALSAEPDTLAELQTALARFSPPTDDSNLSNWSPGACEQTDNDHIAWIDLSARLITWPSARPQPESHGSIRYFDPVTKVSVQLWFRLSPQWTFNTDSARHREASEARRRARAGELSIDSRAVLYGQVLEHIVGNCSPANRPVFLDPSVDEQTAADLIEEHLARIHAEWLMTPRSDLQGATPRDVLLEKQDLVDFDLQNRRDQWSLLGECPIGLHRNSKAFRFSGYGTHEIVIYYDLVRHLLRNCWDQLVTQGAPDLGEKARLRQVRDDWLQQRSNDILEGQSPASVIDAERRRVPLAVTGNGAMIDCDCPLCQMMAESGPVFLHLDGCHMDEDFAFSFHETRAQWEAEKVEWEVVAHEWDKERNRFAQMPILDSSEQRANWSTKLPEKGESPEFQLVAIAACLTELGLELKQKTASASLVQVVNRHFGNLREVARQSNNALLRPVVDKFCDELQEVADQRPDLATKCTDLHQRLHGLAARIGCAD